MKWLDLILLFSGSMPKNHLSLLNKNDVPVTVILHVVHEISLHTVQGYKQCLVVLKVSRRLGRQSILDPAPCTRPWKTMPCTKRFSGREAPNADAANLPLLWSDNEASECESSSTSQADPLTYIQIDYNGNRGTRQATIEKCKERSRTWKFDRQFWRGDFLMLQSGLVNEHVM